MLLRLCRAELRGAKSVMSCGFCYLTGRQCRRVFTGETQSAITTKIIKKKKKKTLSKPARKKTNTLVFKNTRCQVQDLSYRQEEMNQFTRKDNKSLHTQFIPLFNQQTCAQSQTNTRQIETPAQ